MKSNFRGVFSALPTPFLDKKVDFESFARLVDFQLKNGINGFVVNGTTAESPTLSWDEIKELFAHARKISADSARSVPIILGTGSNSTEKTIEMTKKAEDLGADAALVVVPYYNKPPQRGLLVHFTEVAKSTALPIILYNVPGRTITTLNLETILQLSELENICAIKEASGDIPFAEKLAVKLKEQLSPNFLMLSGDDPTYLQFLKAGGSGIISVMSNVLTSDCVRWTLLAQEGRWSEAEADFAKHKNLISQMYLEANPIPLKWMLYKIGLFKSPEMRLPLVTLDSKYYEPITAELKKLEII